jgi:hypothetical protein
MKKEIVSQKTNTRTVFSMVKLVEQQSSCNKKCSGLNKIDDSVITVMMVFFPCFIYGRGRKRMRLHLLSGQHKKLYAKILSYIRKIILEAYT